MSQGEAERLIRRGQRFRVGVGLNPNPQAAQAQRTMRLASLNRRYNARGISFVAGWQPHEHRVIVAGSPGSYRALCAHFAAEADGGVASAAAIRDWYSTDGGNRLSQLTAQQKALVVISHFSEMTRGYGVTEINNFRVWIEAIAGATTPAEARQLWTQVNDAFPASLTYREDAAVDWSPPSSDDETSGDEDSDWISDLDEEPMKLSDEEEKAMDPDEGC